MSHSAPPAPGRRSARAPKRRLEVTVLLAVLLPLLALGALALVDQGAATDPVEPPTRTELTRATLVCPTAPAEDAREVAITSATEDVDGTVQVGLGETQEPADLASGRVTFVPDQPDAVAILGEDDTAPGLVAARFGGTEPAALSCPAPMPVTWFTGVGAGAGHTSVLELINPDAGTAIANITVYGRSGIVEAERLRGISVPGGTSVRLDLATLVPRRDELALQVATVRGRIGAVVQDRFDGIGSAEPTADWLPDQPEPSTSNLLMGLAPGAGRRTLVIANGGDDEVRADVKVVTRRSVFVPEGVPELRVAPHSVQRIAISSALEAALKGGANGLLVDATGPVTATVRSYVEGDLSHAVPSDLVESSATALLPDIREEKSVQLAGATGQGVVTVVARSASGEELDRTETEISPDLGVSVKVPADTVLVTVTVARTTVSGAAMMAGEDGAAVVPLTVPASNGLVPAVRPGLP
ncbi:DUF5719 family protein [Nocardioides sp. SR21]|uniref:DUF5719 family protein n=1 Tax=Nocardioides sp. SR21 TaxID=2919501 RepID=UPI001FA97771|nr:DUF5719 family protein [Nocardioides sp. SR21]